MEHPMLKITETLFMHTCFLSCCQRLDYANCIPLQKNPPTLLRVHPTSPKKGVFWNSKACRVYPNIVITPRSTLGSVQKL